MSKSLPACCCQSQEHQILQREFFSTACDTVTKLRSALDSDTVDMLIFVNKIKKLKSSNLAQSDDPQVNVSNDSSAQTASVPVVTVKQESGTSLFQPTNIEKQVLAPVLPPLPALPTLDGISDI